VVLKKTWAIGSSTIKRTNAVEIKTAPQSQKLGRILREKIESVSERKLKALNNWTITSVAKAKVEALRCKSDSAERASPHLQPEK